MEALKLEEHDDEDFEIVSADEVKQAKRNELEEKMNDEDERFKEAVEKLEEEGVEGLEEEDLRQIVEELRHLEERLHMWREVSFIRGGCISVVHHSQSVS